MRCLFVCLFLIYFCFRHGSILNMLPSMKGRDLLAACFIYSSVSWKTMKSLIERSFFALRFMVDVKFPKQKNATNILKYRRNIVHQIWRNEDFYLKTTNCFIFHPVHTTLEEFENGGFTPKTHQMFSVHTTPVEFENGGFTLKTHQMFSVHTTPVEFENGGFTLKTHQMFSVHTTPVEFENGGFTLKTHQMFSVHTTPQKFENGGFTLKTQEIHSVHTTPERFENATTTGQFGFVVYLRPVRRTRTGKLHYYRDAIIFENLCFQIFSVHTKTKCRCFQIPPVWRAFSKSSVLAVTL